MCDKHDRAITWEFCRGLPLRLIFSGLSQKRDLFKGRCSLEKRFFKQNYCHACHTRFAVFFPLPSCCVSSLISGGCTNSHWLILRSWFFYKSIETLVSSLLKCSSIWAKSILAASTSRRIVSFPDDTANAPFIRPTEKWKMCMTFLSKNCALKVHYGGKYVGSNTLPAKNSSWCAQI